MKPIEPGCLALVISGPGAGCVAKVVRRVPLEGVVFTTVKGLGFSGTCETICHSEFWLIDADYTNFTYNGEPSIATQYSYDGTTTNNLCGVEWLRRLDDDDQFKDEDVPYSKVKDPEGVV